MSKEIEFPNANKQQNKILNMIAKQREKEVKAEQDAFDAEKDKDEFLYLWGHFKRRLEKQLDDFINDKYGTGIHGLEVLFRITKEDSTEELRSNYVYNDKLKMTKIEEIE